MKISKLHIDQFRHLENLDFDFTYQSGERKGQPLDKICFIGQSATGKTSLLELIKEQHIAVNNTIVIDNFFSYKSGIEIINGSVTFNLNNNSFEINNEKLNYKNNTFKYIVSGSFSNLLTEEEKKYLYYFKANLISDKNIDLFTKNPIDLFEKHPGLNDKFNFNNFYSKENSVIFDDTVESDLWLVLLKEILQYRKKFNQKMSDLIHKGLLANQKKLSAEFEKWQKENPNKLELFAEKLNPILEKLNLEVDVFNTEYSIPIKNKRTDEIIPIQNTSTGTKGLLLSFLPLFKLDTKDSIILIDEPERSLYPDMQMDLMDHYKRLATEAQFIVATHSPFIAASFEPDERFILYFDEEGKVAVRRGSSPIGDDPNDMLYNDFGIDYINKYGKKVYNEYLEKRRQLLFEKNEEVKQKLQNEIESIGDKYNF
ncbi:AAA ATPase-like protein [Flavobacterium sp. 1]|uniref:ATP-binding protein n=1 Tax=Flavobacterium sp. 1 TaxID=2035200 RepID=UPI000C24E602|nr:ATP-binding protein [Flavobacterium sp. 1]PJJ10834.1 AAA ATPase-like protein [Flavobacterium sp. 1]